MPISRIGTDGIDQTSSQQIGGISVGRGAGAVSTNTAVGASALAANTTGTFSTAVGYEAGKANTNGYSITAVGARAGWVVNGATNFTAVGTDSGRTSTTAASASFFGANSGFSNTTGSYLVAVGDGALYSNTTASNNTAVGYQAGYANTTGAYNTFIGQTSGVGVTTGTQNTFIGAGSGSQITTGNYNSILGFYNGNQGGLDIRTSSNYIVLSDGAGNPWVYHNSSVGLNLRGYDASDTSGISFRNSSLTKYWGIATNYADFFIADADFSHYARVSQNFTSWSFGSDRRIKTNIADIEYGLDAVMAIQPRQFDYIASGKHDIGFIAQELKEVIPEAVTGTEIEFSDSDTPQERATKTMGVSKDILIPVLVKAIQELKAEFDAYKEAHP